MNALTELFKRKPEAEAAPQAQDEHVLESLSDIAFGDATEIGHEQRLKMLDDAETTLRAALKDGIPEQDYRRYSLILDAIPACRSASRLLVS